MSEEGELAMMAEPFQHTLEGVIITTLEELERAFERVLERHGILGLARRASRWDRSYKGDEWWAEYRARVVQLVVRNVAVSYRDLDQDLWFRKTAGIRERQQWLRAIDQHLVPNRPPGDDGRQFAAFSLSTGDRGTRYLTFKPWLHCAIGKVAGSTRREVARLTRNTYDATDRCERCAASVAIESVADTIALADGGGS